MKKNIGTLLQKKPLTDCCSGTIIRDRDCMQTFEGNPRTSVWFKFNRMFVASVIVECGCSSSIWKSAGNRNKTSTKVQSNAPLLSTQRFQMDICKVPIFFQFT